jgi:hypothetical protein
VKPFSEIQYIKSELRNHLTDENIVDCAALITTIYKLIIWNVCKIYSSKYRESINTEVESWKPVLSGTTSDW